MCNVNIYLVRFGIPILEKYDLQHTLLHISVLFKVFIISAFQHKQTVLLKLIQQTTNVK